MMLAALPAGAAVDVFSLPPIPPAARYSHARIDRMAANVVVKEIKKRYPQAKTPLQFAVVASYWFYNRSYAAWDDSALTIEAGIRGHNGSCGRRSLQLGEVLSAVGIQHRLIGIYGLKRPALGHTAVEARIDGKWVFLDPTLGVVFTKGDWTSFDAKNFLSWEEASSGKGRVTTVFSRYLLILLRKYTSEEYAYMTNILGTDPYNGVFKGNLSQLFSTVPPDEAMRENLALLGTNSVLEFLKDNTSVGYRCKVNALELCPVNLLASSIDVTKLEKKPIGKKDSDFADITATIVHDRAKYGGLYYAGELYCYFDQYLGRAMPRIVLERIPADGYVIINFWRSPAVNPLALLVRDEKNNSVIVKTILVPGQASGAISIPVKKGSRTILIESKSVQSQPEMLGLDSLKFVRERKGISKNRPRNSGPVL